MELEIIFSEWSSFLKTVRPLPLYLFWTTLTGQYQLLGNGSCFGKLLLPITSEGQFYSIRWCWFCLFFPLHSNALDLNLFSLWVAEIVGWNYIICANKTLPFVNFSVYKAWLNWELPVGLRGFYVTYVIRTFVSYAKELGWGRLQAQSQTKLKKNFSVKALLNMFVIFFSLLHLNFRCFV